MAIQKDTGLGHKTPVNETVAPVTLPKVEDKKFSQLKFPSDSLNEKERLDLRYDTHPIRGWRKDFAIENASKANVLPAPPKTFEEKVARQEAGYKLLASVGISLKSLEQNNVLKESPKERKKEKGDSEIEKIETNVFIKKHNTLK